jgi:hypothetical protein
MRRMHRRNSGPRHSIRGGGRRPAASYQRQDAGNPGITERKCDPFNSAAGGGFVIGLSGALGCWAMGFILDRLDMIERDLRR